MVWKLISTLLLRDPRVGGRLVQYLSETRPIRSAARFTAYLYLRGRHALEEGVRNPVTKSSREGLSNFSETFKRELKKGMEEAVEDMKRQKRR